MIIHFSHKDPFKGGVVICKAVIGKPTTWPEGHFYTMDWTAVSCPDCMAHKDDKPEQDLATVAIEYTDDTPMPFGKHTGLALTDVPAPYLHWLWINRPISDRLLEDYIRKNLPALRKEHPDGIWT